MREKRGTSQRASEIGFLVAKNSGLEQLTVTGSLLRHCEIGFCDLIAMSEGQREVPNSICKIVQPGGRHVQHRRSIRGRLFVVDLNFHIAVGIDDTSDDRFTTLFIDRSASFLNSICAANFGATTLFGVLLVRHDSFRLCNKTSVHCTGCETLERFIWRC